MTAFQIGDGVEFDGRLFTVSGVSPMSVRPPVAHLVDVETGERLEVPTEQLTRPDRTEPSDRSG